MSSSLSGIKAHFPVFTHHPGLVYLDSAATSQKPNTVIKAVSDFYEQENANVHRGLYELSIKATEHYEVVRTKVSRLIAASSPSTIAFTKGTTESINIVAQTFLKKRLAPGDKVLMSAMEHHANLIPWQQICQETKASLVVVPITINGDLDLDKLEILLKQKPSFLALTHISNVLGTVNPIGTIVEMSHRYNVPVLIDAAQSVGHVPIDVSQSNVDFLVFSAHKMFGPMGTGVLYTHPRFSDQVLPLVFGGGAIKNVTFNKTQFLDYPFILEAGTPNVGGVIGLGAAIDFINTLDLTACMAWTHQLCVLFRDKINSLPGFSLIGNPENFSGIASFQSDKIHAHDVAGFLANHEIAVRAGHHCAQPLLELMHVPAAIRVSFSIYNVEDDVNKLIECLKELQRFWK